MSIFVVGGLMDGSEEQIAEAQAFTGVAGKGWLLNGGGALSDLFLCLLVICDIGFHSFFCGGSNVNVVCIQSFS